MQKHIWDRAMNGRFASLHWKLAVLGALLGTAALAVGCKEPTGQGKGEISGQVSDAVSGSAVAGASVTTQPATGAVLTDAQGRYTISDVATGSYTVSAAKAGYSTGTVPVSVSRGQTATANLALTPMVTVGTIAGKVTDAGSGQPIAGAAVSTQPATSAATTDAQGNYTIANVAAGSYTVTAAKAGYQSNSTGVTVTAGQTVTANLALTPLPTTGTIAGQVTDASNGQPLTGAAVSTQPASGAVTTDAQGNYSIANVAPGNYTVTAAKAGYQSGSTGAAVTAGQTVTANLALTPLPTTGTIAGTVTDGGTGQPLAGAAVTTQPATSAVTADAQGNYTIANVAPGAYTVTAAKTGYQSGSVNVTVTAGQTVTADIALAQAVSYDGNWSGVTSTSNPISFTIASNAFTEFSIEFDVPQCGATVGTTITYNTPKPITGNSFTITSSGAPPINMSFTVNGTFTSGTSASGTASWTLQLSPPVGSCSASGNVTWMATKQ